MITLLIATNRPGSNTGKVAAHLSEIYTQKGIPSQILDLHELPTEIFAPTSYAEKPASFAPFQEKMTKSSGVVVIVPEYNGGFPGVFKYFIDMLKFPETFAGLPFAFVGVSAGIWGAFRPIEQFDALVVYLHGIIYPERVNIPTIQNHLDEAGKIKSPEVIARLEKQAVGFAQFVEKYGRNPVPSS